MPRNLKPQKVETITVGSRGAGNACSANLMLDRNKLDFFVKLGLEEVRASTANECRKKAYEHFSKWKPETWEPMIAVLMECDGDTDRSYGQLRAVSTDLSFVFYRFERAKMLDGEYLEREHSEDRRHGDVSDSWRFHESHDTVYLPYKTETWAGLQALRGAIIDARRKLISILERPDLEKALLKVSTVGLQLSAAPTKKVRRS